MINTHLKFYFLFNLMNLLAGTTTTGTDTVEEVEATEEIDVDVAGPGPGTVGGGVQAGKSKSLSVPDQDLNYFLAVDKSGVEVTL